MEKVVVTEHGDPSVLEVRDGPRPEPGPEEVLVDVEAIGVNWTEIDQRQGNFRDGPEPPFTPGFEAAGVVAEVGDDVDDWSVGEEVIGAFDDGAYAEMGTIAANRLLRKPDAVDGPAAGAVMIQGFTAHNLVHEWGRVDSDETILVQAAAGGVGSKVVQLASAAGATVLGTASTEEKLAFAADSGADHTIDYTTEGVTDAVSEHVGSVDAVFDGVGGRAFYECFDYLTPGGRIVTYGVASGNVPTVATPRLYYDNVSVVGYDLLTALDHEIDRVHAAKDSLYERLAEGTFDLQVTDVRPLSEAADVHREMEARETTGKVVLVPE